MPKTTFERAVAPAPQPAAEPHTPGPFMRYGVMVRDTVETVGGMFCIRPGKMIVNHAGRTVPEHGDVIAYAYSRADADLFAAAPDMLEALRIVSRNPHAALALAREGMLGEIVSAIAKAEGRA